MPSNNIDDLLIAQDQTELAKLNNQAGTEPLPEEIVSRETIQPEPQAKEEPKREAKPEPKVEAEANEYGDLGQAEPEPEASDDDYGVEPKESKTYTQAEMDAYANRLIRERLARLERNSGQPQPTQQQVQQQAKQAQQGFEYDENSQLDWQQQLKEFIKQTNHEVAQEYQQQVKQAKEQQAQFELEMKFKEGLEKLKQSGINDYSAVVSGQNISDAMVQATRNMKDPAAFFYAAAKRAPDELARIAQYDDPYTQAAAIGRLDEKLRKQAQASRAPKPVSRTQGDMSITRKEASKPSIEDLIAQEDARKLALSRGRR